MRNGNFIAIFLYSVVGLTGCVSLPQDSLTNEGSKDPLHEAWISSDKVVNFQSGMSSFTDQQGLGLLGLGGVISNKTESPRPFPELRLILLDQSGAVVYVRSFLPVEYLRPEVDREIGLPPDIPISFHLQLVDPSRVAMKYMIDLLWDEMPPYRTGYVTDGGIHMEHPERDITRSVSQPGLMFDSLSKLLGADGHGKSGWWYSFAFPDAERAFALDELVRLSGMRRQAANIAEGAINSYVQTIPVDMVRERESVKQFWSEVFDVKLMNDAVLRTLERRYDASRARAAIAYLKSSTARKMSKLEQASNRAGILSEINQFAERLAFNPPPAPRMTMVNEFINQTHAVEVMQTVMSRNMRMSMTAMNAFAPPDRRLNNEQIEAMISGMRTQTYAGMRNGIVTGFLYTYRNVSDEELRQYIEWFLSDDGRWLMDVSKSSIFDMFDDMGVRMAAALEKLVIAASQRPS